MPRGHEIARVARGALQAIALDLMPLAQQDHVQRLTGAVLSPRQDAWRNVGLAMIDAGCRPADIIDIYIPATARRLGDDWLDDAASFADVTLGCVRLRSLLTWADDMLDELDVMPSITHGQVYLLTPEGAQHRLGQHVFMAQLLRHGVAARIVSDPAEVSDADIVMISASGADTQQALIDTVNCARRIGRDPFVILGGGAVEIDRGRCKGAGADLVTNDLDIALSECRARGHPLRLRR
ncbi:Methanogenic corrinoid protein MtbC1 [Jannaschia faecimaris]|uniref:Methanogenic corrinoid protein MtbC1 n=1 Tax=Jannaschia faecimaris TaxID=1244108 RepID=A0A1H3TCU5_9RHOB|nr:hypothetical protein [Jannaschia faecimaris]SDZ48082.1 Methanogenic corrinoid protein MtbC1 [Jannaschia faecimaris]